MHSHAVQEENGDMIVAILLKQYRGFDGVDDIADVVVGDVWAGRKADADFEKALRYAVCVGRGVFVDWLFVHRLPEGTRFDVGAVEADAQCLHVVVGLAVGCSR